MVLEEADSKLVDAVTDVDVGVGKERYIQRILEYIKEYKLNLGPACIASAPTCEPLMGTELNPIMFECHLVLVQILVLVLVY